jgi:hypothetical protein
VYSGYPGRAVGLCVLVARTIIMGKLILARALGTAGLACAMSGRGEERMARVFVSSLVRTMRERSGVVVRSSRLVGQPLLP